MRRATLIIAVGIAWIFGFSLAMKKISRGVLLTTVFSLPNRGTVRTKIDVNGTQEPLQKAGMWLINKDCFRNNENHNGQQITQATEESMPNAKFGKNNSKGKNTTPISE